MSEYENTYEEEINLTDLLFYCLKKWRWIVAAMLIVAVLAGGYKYYSTVKSNRATLEQWDKAEPEEKETLKKKSSVDNMSILQYYQSVIDQKSQALEEQEDYVEESALMRLDPKQLQRGTLSFVLKTEDTDQNVNLFTTLIAAFEAYVTDGRLAQTLYSEDKEMAISDSRYLLTFSMDDSLVLNTVGANNVIRQPGQGIFQVQIVSGDEKSCKEQIKTATQELQAYSEELQEQIGAHELTLLATSIAESQDDSIQVSQTNVLNTYIAAIRDLNALRTEAKTFADNLETEQATEVPTAPVLASPAKAAVKYAILGLVLGAFLAGFVLVVLFLMSDRLRSTENFERKFGMRLLGRVIAPAKGKGPFGILDRKFQRLGEGAYADLPYDEQIKIVATNVKTAISAAASNSRIMLAGTIASKDAAEICTAVGKETEGVAFSDYSQLIFDASALGKLSGYDGVLFIEKKDVSSARLISQECKMAADRNIPVLGAVVI